MARLSPDWEVRGDSSLHIDTIAADHNLSAAIARQWQGNAQFAPDSSSGEVDGSAMISRRSILLTIATLFAGSLPVLAGPRRLNPIRMFDSDNDGTLDLAEVKKAASDLFARLDRDHDGTLDKRELAGKLSARELSAADPDHDGTLTAEEYLAVVEQRFNAANPDKDGTLDAKELNTSAGRALLRLLR